MCLATECIIIPEAWHQGNEDQKCMGFPCTSDHCMCFPRCRKVEENFSREKIGSNLQGQRVKTECVCILHQ